jgi:enterochelin esterase family protein
VYTDKDRRAIAGLSMGGRHTLMATNNNPGVFGWIGVFSSGPQGGVDATMKQQLAALKAGGVNHYWTGAGTTDTARERMIAVHGALKELGFKTSYKEIPGRHYWFLWRDFLGDYAQLLFK